MSKTVKIKCNLGHEHEVLVPDDLITITEASNLAGRQLNTLMSHVKAGTLIGYPTKSDGKIIPHTGNRPPKVLVSRAQVLSFYDLEAQAS